ncbi:MAG TPA: AAA family ATPase [Rhabdochlamydiaceae bacterium]|nr:AAA family ATPase [Rhabdochlamydiaceae bacterium]
MRRLIEDDLFAWKNKPDRKPLIVRGSRQVGKTFIIEKFGKDNFESVVTVNFEELREARKAFDGDLSPQLILRDLSTRLNRPIIPGQTLLFLDEIQACPNALISLRFFKEQLPELHLIAAGSLLEFIMEDKQFSFPVGRVEYLYMRPLSFSEFLEAKGERNALAWIREATVATPIGGATHESLIRSVQEYFIVGGMPEAVISFLQHRQFLPIDQIHQALLTTYENDFGKYPRSAKQKFMHLLFEAAPRLVGEHFKYAKIQPHAQSRDYLEALEVLSRTGLIHQVFGNSASGIPLEVQKNEKRFKLLFLDIGLLPQSTPLVVMDTNDLTVVNRGVLAEQFVGQELIAHTQSYKPAQLYYWEREKKGAEAEIDYVVEVNAQLIPIEVKAGRAGRLKSLKQFMTEKGCHCGVRISQAPLTFENNILSIPFYMIQEIPRLWKNSL